MPLGWTRVKSKTWTGPIGSGYGRRIWEVRRLCRSCGRARSKLRREKGCWSGWLEGVERIGGSVRRWRNSQSSLNQVSASDWIVRSRRRC